MNRPSAAQDRRFGRSLAVRLLGMLAVGPDGTSGAYGRRPKRRTRRGVSRAVPTTVSGGASDCPVDRVGEAPGLVLRQGERAPGGASGRDGGELEPGLGPVAGRSRPVSLFFFCPRCLSSGRHGCFASLDSVPRPAQPPQDLLSGVWDRASACPSSCPIHRTAHLYVSRRFPPATEVRWE